MNATKLTRKLLGYLDYNSNQYIMCRNRQDYPEAISRLHRLARLTKLIQQVCIEHDLKLFPDQAIAVLRVHRHLFALGFSSDDDPIRLYAQMV